MEYGVLLFSSTHDAMKAEKKIKEEQLKARIIPTPETIKKSCGFSLRYEPSDEGQLLALLEREMIPLEGNFHASGSGLTMIYTNRRE